MSADENQTQARNRADELLDALEASEGGGVAADPYYSREGQAARAELFTCSAGLFDITDPTFARLELEHSKDAATVVSEVVRGLRRANGAASSPSVFAMGDAIVAMGFSRSPRIVRTTMKDGTQVVDATEVCTPKIVELRRAVQLSVYVDAAVRGVRVNQRTRRKVDSPIPAEVLGKVLALPDNPFPALASVGSVPLMMSDGSIVQEEGYSGSPGYHVHYDDGTPWMTVADDPSAAERKKAKDAIDHLLRGFPFETETDKANAVAEILTVVTRRMYPVSPVFLHDAPQPDTGKTKLAEIGQVVAMGRVVTSELPPDMDEARKQLFSTALEGTPFHLYDNIKHALNSATLAAMLTSLEWSGRILGVSSNATIPNTFVIVITGNGISAHRELLRRSCFIRLNARNPDPGSRVHPFSLPDYAIANRPLIVWALLTLARAWIADGRPVMDKNPVSKSDSFGEWGRVVGGIVSHAGWKGFMANRIKIREERAMDGDEQNTAEQLARLLLRIEDGAVRAPGSIVSALKDLDDGLELIDDLDGVLPPPRNASNPEAVTTARLTNLGNALKGVTDVSVLVDGKRYVIIRGKNAKGRPGYRVDLGDSLDLL